MKHAFVYLFDSFYKVSLGNSSLNYICLHKNLTTGDHLHCSYILECVANVFEKKTNLREIRDTWNLMRNMYLIYYIHKMYGFFNNW